ncbi:WD repeat-containing protein 90 isoform X5 [Cavia porcellus]|uniref:WD repeat-containing protein 90 isoform X5 n=1 Tax=Cavia porcellus TaxID=10141 RepID=UPI002FE26563
MAEAWQHPFLNVFRYFRVNEWKRSSKEGDVAVVMDKTLKGSVYLIRGSVSANNYLQLPRTSTQSLGLTGRYLYVLFRPLPAKRFVIHLDVTTQDSQVIRVSFSNFFKEFKSSATWLQFPFVFETRTPRRVLAGMAPPGACWTFLQLDLHDILLIYLSRCYGHLKSVKLCANLLVKNLYTSDLNFDPGITVSKAQGAKLPIIPVPREMAFPVPKGESWHDHYIHIRFPSDSPQATSELVWTNSSSPAAVILESVPQLPAHQVTLSKPLQYRMSPAIQMPRPQTSCPALSAPRVLSEASQSCQHSEGSCPADLSVCSRDSSAWVEASAVHTVVRDSQRLTHKSTGMPVALEDTGSHKHFLPDPVLRLKRIIGFGGHSTKWALWTKDGAAVVYPCHAVIVVLHISTGEQRFFLGHTDKVSALALDRNSLLLASAQVQPPSVVRLWDFPSGRCLSLFRSPMYAVCSLSFSSSGALLCGVGRDHQGRTVVVAWGTEQVSLGGEVVALSKVHADFDVQTFRVSLLDETRMASCGQGSIRLWRLRGRTLRSCPVDLGEHCGLEFSDLAFAQALDSCQVPSIPTLYVCSRNGHILEVDPQRMAVRCTHHLLPTGDPGPGITINSLSVSLTACAVGCEDGYLRLWPLDFSSVLLEAEHEGPISSVCISPNGLCVLSTTSSSHLGFLDIPSREYTVLACSHMAPVLALSTEQSRGQLATVSMDHTVRIWDLATLRQLYDFTSCDEAPCAITFHPTWPAVFCGFRRGAIRAFSLESTGVLVEHTCVPQPKGPWCHQGAIIDLLVTPDGNFLFSSCCQGSLVQYSCSNSQCHVLRVAANVVFQDAQPHPNTLAVSRDSRLLAFVGPSKCTVTVMDSASLNELLRVSIGTLDSLDSAVAICFGPTSPGHLLVSTSSNKVMVLDAVSGRTVREVSLGTVGHWHVLPSLCSCSSSSCGGCSYTEEGRPAGYLLPTTGCIPRMFCCSCLVSALWLAPPLLSTRMPLFCWRPLTGLLRSGNTQHSLTPAARCTSVTQSLCMLWPSPLTSSRSSVWGMPSSCGMSWPPLRGKCLPLTVSHLGLLLVPLIPFSLPLVTKAFQGPPQPMMPLEDVTSQARGLPLQQISMPSHISTQPDPHFRPPEGTDGTFSASEEEGCCGEIHSPTELLKSPGPPVFVEKEPSGAGDKAWGAASSSWQYHGHPSTWSTREIKAQIPTRPDSYKHFTARYKAFMQAKNISCPPAGGEQLRLKTVVGYSGNGRANMVWRPDTGFFAYTCGRLVVVEDLHSGAQQHWLGHPEEISTLALSHNAQVLASASCCGSDAALCQIRLWDVPGCLCQQLISHHDSAVQALAFSPDDTFLVTLGDYRDLTLALWSMATYELVSANRLPEPMHGVAFNPWDAGELICVGPGAITFWFLQQHGADISLQVHQEPVPEEMGLAELTSLCYGAARLLYCGSSTGQVCVWDTGAGRCFLVWEADDGEIGLLVCSGSRLVSGSNTRRLRLWAVGAVPELQYKGSSARSTSVFMERELTLDGAIVSASFDSGMDMGVVGTTAGTLWYISWTEGTSTRLISGHRSKVNEVVFSPDESYCATCGEDGSVRVWSLASMELVVQFQVLNQSCLCLAWSPPSCGHPEQQQVVAGYSDGTLRVFSISRTAMELKMHPHRSALTAIAFSTDGQTILSGDKDGLVAVSRPRVGMTFRVLRDHQGAPISVIQSTYKEYVDLGVEGEDLWLAVSEDQRVSVWASNWPENHCKLLDWLSFPVPAALETSGLLPPSLATFCPWDLALLVYVGFGTHEEVAFYSLRQKQVVEKIMLPSCAMSLSLSPGAHLMAVGFSGTLGHSSQCGWWPDGPR